jgi:hypothetical protein
MSLASPDIRPAYKLVAHALISVCADVQRFELIA